MAYKTIDEFIKRLEKAGELVRIKEAVSPYLEIAEINDRMVKNNGKALLFENTGTDFPVLINMMGSEKRIAMALNTDDVQQLANEVHALFDMLTSPKERLIDKLRMLPRLGEIAGWMPTRLSGRGLCQEVEMEEADLSKLPILTTWPYDGGPFITFPMVHTVSPSSGIPNIGMYRMQVLDKQRTAMHWHMHKDGAHQYREYKERGERMPLTVTLGGDPAYIYAASAPLPENIDEYLLAGFLRKKKVRMVKCLTNDIYIPEDVDFVIEGYVDPAEEPVTEGPFGDHTGYYSLSDLYPQFHITKITHRKGAVYSATVVGIPPQEDAWIGLATERIFLNPIKMTMVPEIEDMHMPPEGVFHNIVLSSIKSSYPGQAAKVMNALWGAGQMMFNKFLFLFDRDVELSHYPTVLKEWTSKVHPLKDVYTSRGPMDVLDHAAADFAFGGKMGFDACGRAIERKPQADFDAIRQLEGIIDLDENLIRQGYALLLVKIKKEKEAAKKAARALMPYLHDIAFVVFMEEVAELSQYAEVVWRAANNIDPQRDCFYLYDDKQQALPILFMDALRKNKKDDGFERPWPNIVTMDKETIELVDKKWERYDLGPFIPSPSLAYLDRLYPGEAIAEE